MSRTWAEKKLEGIEKHSLAQQLALAAKDQEIDRLTAEVARYREALESIAANTCCEPCQEAKLVAKSALATQPPSDFIDAIGYSIINPPTPQPPKETK